MKILVVGDSCKDVFIYGKVKRLAQASLKKKKTRKA